MQAIRTKYISATDTRGSRYKATAWAGSVTLPTNNALSSEENHRAAAQALADKFDWKWDFVTGCLFDETYAHVFVGVR